MKRVPSTLLATLVLLATLLLFVGYLIINGTGILGKAEAANCTNKALKGVYAVHFLEFGVQFNISGTTTTTTPFISNTAVTFDFDGINIVTVTGGTQRLWTSSDSLTFKVPGTTSTFTFPPSPSLQTGYEVNPDCTMFLGAISGPGLIVFPDGPVHGQILDEGKLLLFDGTTKLPTSPPPSTTAPRMIFFHGMAFRK